MAQAYVDGLASVLVNLGKVHDRVYGQALTAIEDATIMCLQDAQLECPVDTGDLEKSGAREVQELPLANGGMEIVGTVSFGDDLGLVNYAWYVELGTSKMAAQPFLYPAFTDAESELKSELGAIKP